MKFKQYLTEKTFNVNKDVKFIYDNAFKKFIDSLVKNNYEKTEYSNIDTNIINNNDVTMYTISSKDLPSKEAKNASIINPIMIKCGIFDSTPSYSPVKKIIILSLHKSVLNILFNRRTHIISKNQIRDFYQELKPERIKATISHELSHWMNDTFHNRNITKLIDKSMELQNPQLLKLGKKDINMTSFEIDAQIHGIKQIKMLNKKNWDNMTFADVLFKYVVLRHYLRTFYQRYGKKIGDEWQRKILQRMARENLLGKNMKKFAKPEELQG